MADNEKTKVGSILWQDLTVENAEQVRDFYQSVVGWTHKPEDMGEYSDFMMLNPQGEHTAGVCFARGVNADVPPQWLIYIVVESVEQSAAKCIELGGKVIAGPRKMGEGDFCVIQDPAGAMCALFKPA